MVSLYLDRKFGLSLSLSEITLLFDLSLYLDWTLAQRKAKSKVKVTHYVCVLSVNILRISTVVHMVAFVNLILKKMMMNEWMF